jgi:hypothetical protein
LVGAGVAVRRASPDVSGGSPLVVSRVAVCPRVTDSTWLIDAATTREERTGALATIAATINMEAKSFARDAPLLGLGVAIAISRFPSPIFLIGNPSGSLTGHCVLVGQRCSYSSASNTNLIFFTIFAGSIFWLTSLQSV